MTTLHRRTASGPAPSRNVRRVLVAVATMVAVVVAAWVFGASAAFADPGPTPQPLPTPPVVVPTQPPGTPNPQPGPPVPAPTTPPTTPPTLPADEEPGLFDLSGQIRTAIADFFSWFAQTSLNPVLGTFGETALTTPDLTGLPQVQAAWTGSLVVANLLLVLFVMLGGFTVMTRDTLQNQYGLKEIVPRIGVAAVASNLSLLILGKGIQVTNAVAAGIVGQGVDPKAAAQALTDAVTQAAIGNNFLMSMLILAVVVMTVIVLLLFVIRIAILVLLIAAAPIALLCHALPQTEALAFLWWRAVGVTFGIQIAQALVLLATLRVFLTPVGPTALGLPSTNQGLLRILVCLTMLWLLIKLPGLARRMVFGSLFRKQGRGLISQVIHTVLLIKALGLSSSRRGRSRPAPRTTTRTNPPPPPLRPAPPRPVPPRPTPPGPSTTPFSHTPAPHTPIPRSGQAQPVFSHPVQPTSPRPAPARGAPHRAGVQPPPGPGRADTPPRPARPAGAVQRTTTPPNPTTAAASNGADPAYPNPARRPRPSTEE